MKVTIHRSIEESYFDFLLSMVDAYEGGHDEYEQLLRQLHAKAFVVLVDDDVNRVGDGMNLRDDFFYYEGIQNGFFDGPCSCLEVLVALAKRCDEILNDPDVDRTDEYFWMMLGNLGLTKYTDDNFDLEKVENIIEKWVLRDYDELGRGGIFPVKGWDFKAKGGTENQKKLGLWGQMCNFIDENDLEYENLSQ